MGTISIKKIAEASAQGVLAKLLELQKLHDKKGASNRLFGVDTLAIIFSTPHNTMMRILNELVSLDEVRLFSRTPGRASHGKSPTWYVSLCG